MKKLLTLLFCLISFNAYANDDILIKAQNHYKEIQNFKATFTQELTHQESGTAQTRNGTIEFAKPLLVRFETLAPNPELLIIGNEAIYDYLPEDDIVYKYSLEVATDSGSLISVITGQSPLSKDFEIDSIESEGNLTKFLLYPYTPTSQLVEAIVWIDPASLFITKVRILDLFGNVNQISLSDIQTNTKIDANSFNFTMPDGVDIEDLTNPDNVNTRALFN